MLCHPDGRAAFRELIEWGLVDAFRAHHPYGGIFSWWDYRMLGFPKNDGLRIDGILVTKHLAERIRRCLRRSRRTQGQTALGPRPGGG